MMITKSIIQVEKIKCGGCGNSISTKLLSQKGVNDVKVDVENGTVTFDSESEATLDLVRNTLSKMGYPEDDPTMLQSAKSYVSCMIGRVS